MDTKLTAEQRAILARATGGDPEDVLQALREISEQLNMVLEHKALNIQHLWEPNYKVQQPKKTARKSDTEDKNSWFSDAITSAFGGNR